MQDVKKPYVQMPKADNDEAVKLLADIVLAIDYYDPDGSEAYKNAVAYLDKHGVNKYGERIENHV